MTMIISRRLLPLLAVSAAIGVSIAARAAGDDAAPAGAANLALAASPTASYVSGDTTAHALNGGAMPRNSADNRRGSYGNWPRTGTQWVQYEWSQPISTRRIDVYWWADGRGIKEPKACRLSYWDGARFAPVGHPVGLGVAGNQVNTTSFDEVSTSKLRLEIDSDGTFSSGILQWKVFDSGKSPKFPPVAVAGEDRVVILGGKTYLAGAGKSVYEGGAMSAAWSKASGPGEVTFADQKQAITSARFSAPGDYLLKLTVFEGGRSAASTLRVKVEPPPPVVRLDPIDPVEWKVDSPLWNGRIKALITNWIPHCAAKLNEPGLPEGGFSNFVQAGKRLAGKPYERRQGPPWCDAYVHNTVESICLALMVDPQGDAETLAAQKAMRDTLETWIPAILSAQEPDGYLQTYFTGAPRARWRDRGAHEGYTGGYFIESALAHYLMTRKTDRRMVDAARKLADCWYANIGPAPKREWYDGHQEMEQALVRLGRFVDSEEGAGKGRKYIELAKFLLDSRRNGSEYDQSHVPVTHQYEAVGHAVRAVYSYSGMADIAMETGDADYQSAVKSIWENIVNKKYYVTGGVGSGETSEGFGPDYSLRNNAYCESCSGCGELFFQFKMNLAYHDAKYADLYEETLYNAILGDIDLDGRNFYYQNPLNGGPPRYDWHDCPCCVGNIPRTLLMLPTWMYTRGSDGLYVNLYVGSAVTLNNIAGTKVQMVQTTDYPWNGKVSLAVNPAVRKRFTIRFRVPNRQVSGLYTAAPASGGLTGLTVNGSRMTPVVKDGYAAIDRTWRAGDKIQFELPMAVQRVKASEKVEADAGRVALRFGPLIYNIEAADQDINKVLGSDSPLTAEWKRDLLGGVMVVKGAFADGSPLTAIPNYARNNRMSGANGRRGGSIVWIKDR